VDLGLIDDIFRVDYFSLDIEGPELEVIETIPWDRVDIGLIDDIFRVDYFSLDIEGPELEVLETIPWERVDIGLIDDIFRVDYFSLDIEGPELEVLETIPWDRVDITVISVETEFFGEFMEKKQKIRDLLEAQGTANRWIINTFILHKYI